MSANMYDVWDNGDRHEIRQQLAKREEIIRMARECGVDTELDTLTCYGGFFKVFEQFAALVAAAEREACAKLCEELELKNADGELGTYVAGWSDGTDDCAAAIRARGETK